MQYTNLILGRSNSLNNLSAISWLSVSFSLCRVSKAAFSFGSFAFAVQSQTLLNIKNCASWATYAVQDADSCHLGFC